MHFRAAMAIPSVIIVVSFCGACREAPGTARSMEQESNIREAVFRYQMNEWSKNGPVSSLVCLDVMGTDPSDEFMKRLIPGAIRAIKASQCDRIQVHEYNRPAEKQTHQPATILSEGEVHWESDERAHLEGSYDCGMSCSGGFKFQVSKIHGKWTVVETTSLWVT